MSARAAQSHVGFKLNRKFTATVVLRNPALVRHSANAAVASAPQTPPPDSLLSFCLRTSCFLGLSDNADGKKGCFLLRLLHQIFLNVTVEIPKGQGTRGCISQDLLVLSRAANKPCGLIRHGDGITSLFQTTGGCCHITGPCVCN